MPTSELFSAHGHRNILLEDFGHGLAVQANQHLIVHGNSAMILDPGGHKVYMKIRSEIDSLLRGEANLTDIFISHQDPDTCAAINGWLITTEARARIPALWSRFITHFGVDSLVADRIDAIPDQGTWVNLGGCELAIFPAHFLHSCGNFQVYDPVSKILYSGDLGASLGQQYWFVDNFQDHIQYMEGFHRRYMVANKAIKGWVELVRTLDVETIAPQHGAMMKGRHIVEQFLDWIESLDVGLDYMTDIYELPPSNG